MRIEEVKIKTVDELTPEEFRRAHQKWNDNTSDIPWADETYDSLKKLFEKCQGITLKDWSLGAYHQGCYVKFQFHQEEAADLCGARALAWIENNLLAGLRIPAAAPLVDVLDEKGKRIRKGRYYFIKAGGNLAEDARGRRGAVGEMPACPLTGYCADDDLIEALLKDIKDGMSLRDAFRGLADEVRRLLESEDEYQRSEEAFRETCAANGYEFDEDGDLV